MEISPLTTLMSTFDGKKSARPEKILGYAYEFVHRDSTGT